MKKMISGIFAAAMIAILFTSCSQAPTAQLDAATAALEEARTVEAERYLTNEFIALNDSLNAVIVAIDAEKEKSMGSRNFKLLAESLDGIKTEAEMLKANTEVRKAEVRVQVENALVELTGLINNDKDLLSRAPVTARSKDNLQVLQDEVTVIESSVNEINTLVSNGDYLTALEKVNVAKTKASSVYAELLAYVPQPK